MTGGPLLFPDLFIGNIVTVGYFLGLWPFMFVMLYSSHLHISQAGLISISILIAVVVFVTKVALIFINKKLDDAIDIEDPREEILEDTDGIDLPPGISRQLWDARMILFNETIPIDERAMQLIGRGFDPDEVFRFVALMNDGTITQDMRLRQTRRRAKINLIVIRGRVFRWDLDREQLACVFTRPSGVLDVIRSTIIALLMTYALSYSSYYGNEAELIYGGVLAALSIMSMLHPPACEVYSTTLHDPAIGYTRPTLIILFCSLAKCCEYFRDHGTSVLRYDDWEFLRIGMCGAWKFLPLFLLIGVFGHPVTTLHACIESLNMYAFGVAGSSCFLEALKDLVISVVHGVVMGTLFYFDKNPGKIPSSLFAVMYATFFVQFSSCDFSWKRLKSVILWRFLALFMSAIGGMAVLAKTDMFSLISYSLFVIHFVFDVVIPYGQVFSRYLFVFYGKLFDVPQKLLAVRDWYRHITVPFYLVYLLVHFDLAYSFLVAPFLVMIAIRTSLSVPHIYTFGLFIAVFTLQIDFEVSSKPTALLIGLIISRKLVCVMRNAFTMAKLGTFSNALFENSIADRGRFLQALLLSLGQFSIPTTGMGVHFLTFLWSVLIGAPPLMLHGSGRMVLPSTTRPNAFYDASTVSDVHEGFLRIEKTHALEVPVYTSMEEALRNNLFDYIKQGRLGIVTDDSFYLFVDGDLMAILHIIAIEPKCIHFQIRGLEYVQQTLCHEGEGSILQQLVIEQRERMASFTHSLAYLFSCFQLRAKELPLDMVTVTNYEYLTTVYNVLGNETLKWFYRAIVYTCIGNAQAFQEGDNSTEIDYSHFSGEEREFLELVFRHSRVAPSAQLVRQIDDIWTYVYSSLTLGEADSFVEQNLLSLFNGDFPDDNEDRKNLIAECTRYGVVLSFNASAGLAPTPDEDENDFITFMNEQACVPALPITSEVLSRCVAESDGCVITMNVFTSHVELIRFSRSRSNWAVFQLETQTVKGFWANEARDILYFTITSNERPGIQFNLHFLRNITNQSCNPPMGYPTVVSNVNRALSKQ